MAIGRKLGWGIVRGIETGIVGVLRHKSQMTRWGIRWVEKYDGYCWEIGQGLSYSGNSVGEEALASLC